MLPTVVLPFVGAAPDALDFAHAIWSEFVRTNLRVASAAQAQRIVLPLADSTFLPATQGAADDGGRAEIGRAHV